jgi:hypothetical protein
MENLELKGNFLALPKALVIRATAKVHINGLFTSTIPILISVCQSDPLASLIFAIFTQPLLYKLDQALNQDNAIGIKIHK